MILIEILRLKNDIGKNNKIAPLIFLEINIFEIISQKDDIRKRIIMPRLTKEYKVLRSKLQQISRKIFLNFLLHY